jgi:hypothetical protein
MFVFPLFDPGVHNAPAQSIRPALPAFRRILQFGGDPLMARRKAGAGVLVAAVLGLAAYGATALSGRTGEFAPTNYAAPLNVPAATAADTAPREWLYIHGPLRVRAEPGEDARVLRTLAAGDRVQLGSRNENGWSPLYTAGEVEGYVYRASALVQADPPAAPERAIAPPRSEGSRVYHRGPRGGCYVYTSSGSKQYVDRDLCD